MQKTILVTGGAGFLGSHLCEFLLLRGQRVICLDNYSTGRARNIESLKRFKTFELVDQDITDPISVEMDEIFNLACPASPNQYQQDPVKTVQTNIIGALNVLDAAKKNNARVLQASTSEVYGNPLVHPQPENYWGNVNPIGVRSCYDEGKRCAETLFFDFHRQFSVEIKVARIFNTYGPKMQPDDGRVVSNFILQALTNQNITIYGNGKQTRSFCYVDDMIKGFCALMNTGSHFQGPVNLGNATEFTIEQLAHKIISFTGSKSKIKFEPLPSDDPERRKPDVQLAQKELNWIADTQIDEGLEKTIKYFEALVQDKNTNMYV